MFSGIIKSLARVSKIDRKGKNIQFTLDSEITPSLNIDQSVAHNGVCLTVEGFPTERSYQVTAIDETLKKSNLGRLNEGDLVNLETSLSLQTLIDGHLVQGHVDATGTIEKIVEADGSSVFTISFPEEHNKLIVEKGSVCVNGISLTAFDVQKNTFSIAIIPYTMENTNLKTLQQGSIVNLEFDIIGKYILKSNFGK